jgi:DNA-binding NarL/FixJ family response regulator
VKLTDRQLDLLALHASGYRIRDAARELHIERQSAYNAVASVKRRLRVSTLAACVMRAHAAGLLSHPTGPTQAVERVRDPDPSESS